MTGLQKIERRARDLMVHLKASHASGKTITNTLTSADICELIESLAQEVRMLAEKSE